MVHRLVVSYGQPDDPGAFDDYYRDTHVPLTMEMPGLQRFAVGRAHGFDPSRPTPYLVAELDFATEQAMQEALASSEGKASAADVSNFATGGATFLHYEVREVQAGMPQWP
jgi:uncharacterized protein (TIGR02118 family)